MPDHRATAFRLAAAVCAALLCATANRIPAAETTVQPAASASPERSGEPSSDGWAGQRSTFLLGQTVKVAPLVVRGQVPALGTPPFAPTVTITVEGVEVAKQALAPGDFEIRTLVIAAPGPKHVTVAFDGTCTLPAPDGRTVSALLTLVALERTSALREAWRPEREPRQDIAGPGDGVALGKGWNPFETWKGLSFRWAGEAAEIALAAEAPGILTADLEAGPGLAGKAGKLRLVDRDGGLVDIATIGKRSAVDLAVGAAALLHQPFHFQVDGGGRPTSAADSRILDVRIFALSYRAAP